jgi:hypothetical protein
MEYIYLGEFGGDSVSAVRVPLGQRPEQLHRRGRASEHP